MGVYSLGLWFVMSCGFGLCNTQEYTALVEQAALQPVSHAYCPVVGRLNGFAKTVSSIVHSHSDIPDHRKRSAGVKAEAKTSPRAAMDAAGEQSGGVRS